MSAPTVSFLGATYGQRSATRLATAYEAAILRVCSGELGLMPDRQARLRMVEAMLVEAERCDFDVQAMTQAALEAGRATP